MWRKGKGPKYKGSYMRDQNGERVFVLSAFRKNGQIHNITFESYEMARKLGWRKV